MYINEALRFIFLRFTEKKEVLENEKLKISNFDDGYGAFPLGIFLKRLDFEEILYLLKNESLFDTLKSKDFTRDVFDDIFAVMEILLRIFKFHKAFYINDRLKHFCYINILLNNRYNISREKNDLNFENILFFNPCSEEFITRNKLINGEYIHNGKHLKLSVSFENIFLDIFKLKQQKKAYARIAKNDIELLYSILKEIINSVFESQSIELPKEYLRLEKIFNDKKNTYNSLLKAIDYFTLLSNKSDDKNASLYYQSNETFEILNLAKRNSNIKFTSEYIIDSYIFKFYKNPDEFVNFLTFLKEQDIKKYIKFSIILLSHPFITHNLESKKSIIESNLDEVVPENGYAYEKIKRFKLIFSTAD